jgi:hypothetical protein
MLSQKNEVLDTCSLLQVSAGDTNKKSRAIADPANVALKASFVSRHHPVR